MTFSSPTLNSTPCLLRTEKKCDFITPSFSILVKSSINQQRSTKKPRDFLKHPEYICADDSKEKSMTPQQLSFSLFVKCLHWSSRKSSTKVKLKCKNVTTHSPVYISFAMRLLLRTNGFDLHKNPKPKKEEKKIICKPKASLFVQTQLLHYELLMLVLRQFCTFIQHGVFCFFTSTLSLNNQLS